jgi:hypothetical protein
LYIGASALVLPGIIDPSTLEAIACQESPALAADLGLNNIFVASDPKQVIGDIAEGSRER